MTNERLSRDEMDSDDQDRDDDLESLDERIAALSDAIERCRKISLAAKIMAGGGAAFLAAMLVGLAPSLPSTTIAAMAAVLGGIVLLGSNASTWAQAETALAATRSAREAARAAIAEAMFDRPYLRIVGDERPTLH
jgi:hypothetical protein